MYEISYLYQCRRARLLMEMLPFHSCAQCPIMYLLCNLPISCSTSCGTFCLSEMQLNFIMNFLLNKSETAVKAIHLAVYCQGAANKKAESSQVVKTIIEPCFSAQPFMQHGSALSRSIIPTKISTRWPWNIKAEAEQGLKASLTRGCCICFIFHDDGGTVAGRRRCSRLGPFPRYLI